jgi:NADH:ubiquinone oxidoreductase subunit 5 (subunit L)/multisubunit Na+/H+ antiporter MnhA subunit
MSIGSLALIGVPFLAGYYSKDNILESCFNLDTLFGRAVFIIGSLSALLTALYSCRLLLIVFFNIPNIKAVNCNTTTASQWFKKIALMKDVDNIIDTSRYAYPNSCCNKY